MHNRRLLLSLFLSIGRVKGGRPRSVDMRQVLNTIFYQCRSGCQWDMLPYDPLPKSTVYDYSARRRDDGTLQSINDRLVSAVRMLEAPSRVPALQASIAKASKRVNVAAVVDTMVARKSLDASEILLSTRLLCC